MNRLFQLEDKVALITGSTRGLGRAIVRKFAEAGCKKIVLNSSTQRDEEIESLKDELEEMGIECLYMRADVKKKTQVIEMFSTVEEYFGQIDILVNNAGILSEKITFTEIQEYDWDRVMDTNLKGTFLCMQEGIKHMLNRKTGVVVNISSTAGVTGGSVGPQYGASKAGMIALTKATSKMYARDGIRINAVVPGDIKTEMLEGILNNPAVYKERTGNIPMGRFSEPEEIANAVLFLATPMSSFSTGAFVHATGGRV